MGSVPRRLRDRIEMAAGLRHKAPRFPPARLPHPVQPVAIGVGQLLADGRCTGVAAHGHLAVPPRAWRCGVPDDVRALPYESVVVRGRRRGTGGGDVPRGRHQLRNVPWALARSRRAAEGRRQVTFDRCNVADQFSTPARAAIRGGVRAVPRAVGGARCAGRRRRESFRNRASPSGRIRSSFPRPFHGRRSIATADTARRRSSARRSRARSVFAKATRRAGRATIPIRRMRRRIRPL